MCLRLPNVTQWEGGVRQTAVWAGGRLPRNAVGRRSPALGHVADIFPTFAELAGVSGKLLAAAAVGPVPLDGVSLLPVLQDPTSPSPRTEVLIDGQGWSADTHATAAAAAAAPALICNSSGRPSGMAYHQYRNASQLPLPSMDAASADRCAAACCGLDSCTGWALTRPQRPQQGGCTAKAPCCWLLSGGVLAKSVDPSAFSGASGRVSPSPPGPSPSPGPSGDKPGALRVGDWKLIVGNNKYADWYSAPEDSTGQAAAAARALCKLDRAGTPHGAAAFPPPNASNCVPHCLFNLATDPCETENLATAQPARLATMLARLRQLSATPVPYDSCLPGCTAALACETRLRYKDFFGPYFPAFPALSGDARRP